MVPGGLGAKPSTRMSTISPAGLIRMVAVPCAGPPVAEMSWMGLSVPIEFGGSGADVATAAVFCEELARRFPSLATDWLVVSMTARVLREFASPAQQAELLPRLAAGDFLMAFGMSEPDGGTDVLALKTRASLEGGEWVVRGQKLYTSLADDADAILGLLSALKRVRADRPSGNLRGIVTHALAPFEE